MSSRPAVAIVAMIATCAMPALAQETGETPVSVSGAANVEPAHLDLGDLSGAWPERFVLFKDYWSPDMRDVAAGPPTFWRGAQVLVPTPPRLVGLESFGLSLRFGEEVGPEGRHRIVLAPLYRNWDDLNGWEKFAVTLQYAGAAAAIGHFAGKLVH